MTGIGTEAPRREIFENTFRRFRQLRSSGDCHVLRINLLAPEFYI